MCARMRDVSGCSEFSKNRDIWRQVMAEFIGTLLLVLLGCASTIEGWNDQPSPQMLIQVALTFGIVIAGIVQAIGHISGGHINPAVTIAFLVTGKISVAKSIAYVVAQCLGAICGAALLQALTPPDFHNALGVADLHPTLTPTQGFGVEFFATFTLVLVVFSVCDENRTDLKGSAPLIIGLYVTAAILATGHYTGANLNPARSLGPAVIVNKWTLHWVYWAGPIVGGIVAAHIYQKAFKARSPDEQQQESEPVRDVRYQVVKIEEKDIINDRTSTI